MAAAQSWHVYQHLNADGELLYIGCTGDMAARIRSHASRSAWWPEVAHVDSLAEYASRSDALDYEAVLIMHLDPPNNRMHTPHEPPPAEWLEQWRGAIELAKRDGARRRAAFLRKASVRTVRRYASFERVA